MDAIFGLPRKKAAGESYRDALHGQLFFFNQIDVDAYVNESQRAKATYVSTSYVYKLAGALSIRM